MRASWRMRGGGHGPISALHFFSIILSLVVSRACLSARGEAVTYLRPALYCDPILLRAGRDCVEPISGANAKPSEE